MIVELHNRFRDFGRHRASRVLILDDDNQPLAAVVKVGNSNTVICRGDPGFRAALGMFGLDKVEGATETLDIPTPTY